MGPSLRPKAMDFRGEIQLTFVNSASRARHYLSHASRQGAAAMLFARSPCDRTNMRAPLASTSMSRRALCLALALGAGIVACSSPPKPPPPKPPLLLAINIVGGTQLNPDARMRPSPVVVRVYELKSAAQFNSADFLSLYDKDQSVLGGDVVTREEFVLRPGEKKAINKLLPAETKFIGVVAAFRELDSARWRGLVPIAPNKDNTMTISLDSVSIQATATP